MAVTKTISASQITNGLVHAGNLQYLDWDRIGSVISLILEGHTKENFDAATTPEGEPWPPLKPATIRARRKGPNAGSAKPLRDTGLLMASYSAQGSEHHAEASVGRIEFGSNVEYAIFHQEGTRTIPQREHLGLNDEIIEEVTEFIVEEFTKQVSEMF